MSKTKQKCLLRRLNKVYNERDLEPLVFRISLFQNENPLSMQKKQLFFFQSKILN